MNKFKNFLRRIRILAIALSIAIVTFLSYSFIDYNFEITKNLDIFTDLFKQLNLNYVDEVKPGELMETGIDAMLQSLDPYTNYIPESEIETYRFMTTGEYGGIGALIHKRDEYVIIADPYEGFPAQKAGIIAGDKIIEINGKSTKGKSIDDVSIFLKGQPGSEINLKVERTGAGEPLDIKLTREEIKIDNIPYYGIVGNDIAYIGVTGFTQNAGKEVRDAFNELRKEKQLKGAIIDLRGNGGGLLIEAVNLVNVFVKKGELVVSTRGRIVERNRSYKTLNSPVDTEIPVVFLVDESSASASEIAAGAIQDMDRGVVIGQKSFGKGLVQNVVRLSYNSQMKVTVAKYYIPSGRCIQAIDYSADGRPAKLPDSLKTAFKTSKGRVVYDGGGIEPDIHVDQKDLSPVAYNLIAKYLIFDFATEYSLKHKEIKDPHSFIINDDIFSEFKNWLKNKEFEYETYTERELEQLKKYSEEEKYYAEIEQEFKALQDKVNKHKKEDVDNFKDEISRMLRLEIVSRYYYQKGRLISSLQDDPDLNKAIEILHNPTMYKEIIDGKAGKNRLPENK